MCGSCSEISHADGRRRWTSTHYLVLGLMVALFGLSAVGVVFRLQGQGGAAHRKCAVTAADATAYQAAVTRDIRADTAVLVADTNAFAARVRAGAESGCPELRRFVNGTRAVLAT